MVNILFYSVITLTFIFLAIIEPEGTLNFVYRIDAYLTLAWKWLSIAPGYVRMLVLQRYMLWKMRRQFKLTRPLPNKL
jgi:hypothetical protein